MLSKGLGWIKRNILNQKRQGHWYILKEKEQFSGMLGFKKREELIEKWEESRKRKLRQYNFACDRVKKKNSDMAAIMRCRIQREHQVNKNKIVEKGKPQVGEGHCKSSGPKLLEMKDIPFTGS